MATTEGSLRSASLNGFKIADPLVIDAKYDPTLMERGEKQSFSTFLPCVCYRRLQVRWIKVNLVKKALYVVIFMLFQ